MQCKFTHAALSAVLLFAGSAMAAGLFDDVIARGEGIEVRRGQLDDAFVAYKANLAARGQNIPEDKRLLAEAQLLDRLIVAKLLVQKASPADKAKAREKAENFIAESMKAASSEEAFLRQLRSLSMTAEQFTNRIVEQAIAEELLLREVKSKITITPEQIKHFYETNEAAFRTPEMARASHILIATRDLDTRRELSPDQKKAKRERAEQVLERARKGEDFEKLAELYSEDPGVKENKGEYKFTRAKDDPRRAMMPEFEAAAFALKPGEISGLVTTEYGYHIIKLHEMLPPRKAPLTEVTDKIREHLLNQETERRLPDYFAKLKEEARVKILDEKLAEAMEEVKKQAQP